MHSAPPRPFPAWGIESRSILASLVPHRKSPASLVLLLLLSADGLFLVLHVLYLHTGLTGDRSFWLEQDRGYAEVLQYMKEYWIALLLLWLAVRRREPHYAAWTSLFLYFMVDDWMQVHERLGGWLVVSLQLQGLFGLRGQDFGELIVSGTVAMGLLPFGVVTFVRASDSVRAFAIRMGLIVMGVVLFGVGIDVLHQLVDEEGAVSRLIGTIEDWGEMLVMTVGCAYVFQEALLWWSGAAVSADVAKRTGREDVPASSAAAAPAQRRA